CLAGDGSPRVDRGTAGLVSRLGLVSGGLLLLLGSCSRLTFVECSFRCDANHRCAAGACGTDGYCHAEGDARTCPPAGGDGGPARLTPSHVGAGYLTGTA